MIFCESGECAKIIDWREKSAIDWTPHNNIKNNSISRSHKFHRLTSQQQLSECMKLIYLSMVNATDWNGQPSTCVEHFLNQSDSKCIEIICWIWEDYIQLRSVLYVHWHFYNVQCPPRHRTCHFHISNINLV